ncbi:MAG: hypothetical protein GQ477_04155 [Nanohaloarchaea archaeon]|nr:hypothetical protein [Candidatus Nanohaloarchaea archaeon]
MVTNENIERLKKAIGIDFNHSHAPIDQPLPQTGQPQNIPTQTRPQEIPQTQNNTPQIQPRSVLPQKATIPQARPQTQTPNMSHNQPIQPNPINQRPITQKPQQTIPNPVEIKPAQKPNSALFVKIDRHVEITDDIHNTRIEMKKMLDTISLLNKAEKLKSEAVEKIEKRLNVFDEKLDNIDSNLVAPKEFSSPSAISIRTKDADLDNLQSEITKLKTEIDNL